MNAGARPLVDTFLPAVRTCEQGCWVMHICTVFRPSGRPFPAAIAAFCTCRDAVVCSVSHVQQPVALPDLGSKFRPHFLVTNDGKHLLSLPRCLNQCSLTLPCAGIIHLIPISFLSISFLLSGSLSPPIPFVVCE